MRQAVLSRNAAECVPAAMGLLSGNRGSAQTRGRRPESDSGMAAQGERVT